MDLAGMEFEISGMGTGMETDKWKESPTLDKEGMDGWGNGFTRSEGSTIA